ncbi:hypothetical protein M9H77_06899 [Catharanthus roseus]|uniref:Uncharacterized protein n=1 Tax=Catharanthus roseus TaxID=4058 RepID=A0ACC0BTE6_CATRO|nr:hypothetical protein M9H77_06899 [Catharanthus roseus]
MTSSMVVDEEEETSQALKESTSPEEEEVPKGKSERKHDDPPRLEEPLQVASVAEENEKNKLWIPPAEEDWLREHNYVGFRSIKKTTQTSIEASFSQLDDEESKDNESYDLSAKDAPPTVPIDAFQTKMRPAFEQLHVTQDIHGAQLVEIVESTAGTRTNWHIRGHLFIAKSSLFVPSRQGFQSLLFFVLYNSYYIKPQFLELIVIPPLRLKEAIRGEFRLYPRVPYAQYQPIVENKQYLGPKRVIASGDGPLHDWRPIPWLMPTRKSIGLPTRGNARPCLRPILCGPLPLGLQPSSPGPALAVPLIGASNSELLNPKRETGTKCKRFLEV